MLKVQPGLETSVSLKAAQGYNASMRKSLISILVISLFAIMSPVQAATKATSVTAAFKTLLNTTGDSLNALEQKYEADIDELDATLAAAIKAADATYDQVLLVATTLYAPKIAAANKAADDSLKLFNASNKVKVGAGGGFFGGTNLANYLDCTQPELKVGGLPFEIAKRYCANNFNYARPGAPSPTRPGANIGGEDWQSGDFTTIQIFNSGEELVQNGIAAGYIIPVDLVAFDTSRIGYKQALADVASLTALNGKARVAAKDKRDKTVAVATTLRTSALANLDEAYETAKAELEAQETAADLALLAAKRASKDAANFDSAFAIAYKFEYNRKMVGEIADAAWTGEWTFRTIDTIIEVNKLAAAGDSIGRKYSKSQAAAFNSAVGNAFTNEPDFRAALKVLTAIYKQTTKVTLRF